MLVLDTDTVIYYLRGVPSVVRRLLAADPAALAVTRVNEAELYFGAYYSRRVRKNLGIIQEFLGNVRILDIDAGAAEMFGKIKSDLIRRGEPIPDLDILIAAVCLAGGHTLITNNMRHFGRIRGLMLDNWVA